MDQCSVLEAALRHNPLFFLANPNAAKKEANTENKLDGANSNADSSEDEETPIPAAGKDSEKDSLRLEEESPKDLKEIGNDRLHAPSNGVEGGKSVWSERRSLSRRIRKKRKLKALLNMIFHNDQTKSASSTTSEASPEKRARLAPESSADGEPLQDKYAGERVVLEKEQRELEGSSYKQMRDALKKKRKKIRRPSIELSTSGDHASLLMAAHSRTPLFLRDIQTLLLNACVPEHAPWPTRWCNLHHAGHLSHALCVIVDGLSLRDLQLHSDVLRATMTLLPVQTEVVSPGHYGTTVAEEVLNVPLSMTQKHRLVKQVGSLDSAVQAGIIRRQWGTSPSSPTPPTPPTALPRSLPRSAAIGRTQLLLDVSQLIEEGYPLPNTGHYSKQYGHFVPTSDKYKRVTDTSPMFAIDCEMCLTRDGSELTSISVLDETEHLVYGTLVKPDNPILDYRTRWSGITEERLRDVTTKLPDVQRKLRKLLPPDAILIGQSLNNDLRAMQMMHPYIIDTSVIFNITGMRQKKTKLSLLSYMFLGETIQCDVTGHDATEDALASLRLVQRKLSRGYTYGDAVQGGYVPAMNGADREDDATLPAAVNMDGYYTSLLGRMDEVGVSTCIVATGPDVEIYRVACDSTNHPSLSLKCVANNRQATDQAIASLPSADLTLCHMDLRHRLHWSSPADTVRAHLKRLDKRLRRLYRAAPVHTLVTLVCAGTQTQNGEIENGVCLTAVKQDMERISAAAAENDADADTQQQTSSSSPHQL